MYSYETKLRVRYAETDQMGYVYYGNYSMYYEVGRVECLRNLGITYKELEEQGIIMPVVENHSQYLAPAIYDDLLTIKVIIKKMPSAKISFDYEIRNEEGKLIHTGETILVFVNKISGKPTRPPKELNEVLNPYFR
jgi:acyl-CoA thioester hydrolase